MRCDDCVIRTLLCVNCMTLHVTCFRAVVYNNIVFSVDELIQKILALDVTPAAQGHNQIRSALS